MLDRLRNALFYPGAEKQTFELRRHFYEQSTNAYISQFGRIQKFKRPLLAVFFSIYSLLNASTGSFLDAALAGINPPTKVNTIDKPIKIKAASGFNCADKGISPVK